MIYYHNLNPILLSFGPLSISWYGVMYVLGFICAYLLLKQFSKQKFLKLSIYQIETFLFYCFIGLLLGARLFYVLVYNFDYYLQNPLEMIAIWKGIRGLSFHGGLLGIIMAAIIFSWRYQVSFWNIGDASVIVAPIGLFFGRLGNFINGELYGRLVTSGKWGVVFKDAGPFPRHPSQLYEAFFEGIILFGLMLFFKGKVKKGQLISLFLIFYGIFRFCIEYFREPDSQLGFIFLTFSMGQVLCFLMVLSGVFLWVVRK